MNPHPHDRSVLLLDNASLHHKVEVQQLCVDHGVVLEFLPAAISTSNTNSISRSSWKATSFRFFNPSAAGHIKFVHALLIY